MIAANEREKFLFYRGVGEFQPPISVEVAAAGQVRVRNLSEDALPSAILFENHDGRIRYRLLGAVKSEVTAGFQKTAGDLAALKQELERVLTAQGLFPRESHAMVETWRDSWFEEGARLFYVLPAGSLESILPLEIRPTPDRVARVFVGRVELLTPEVRNIVSTAIAQRDRATLEKYGRFLQPLISGQSPINMVHEISEKYLRLENGCGREW